MNKVHFQSSNKEWETPDSVFTPLQKEFKIVLDVCAGEKNTKCKAYFDKKLNGLSSSWGLAKEVGGENAACWMNPPYGRGIDRWVHKAHEESLKGITTIALLPARTDTSWFHNYILNKHEVRFLKGRIKFVDAPSSAPFPSMIVIFKPAESKPIQKWLEYLKFFLK